MSSVARESFHVECPGCRSRCLAPAKAAGKRLACPKCGTKIQITERRAPEFNEDDAYELDESAAPGERPCIGMLTPHERVYESSDDGRSDTHSRSHIDPTTERSVPPRWPLLRGVFSMPFQPAAAVRTVALAGWLYIDFWAFTLSMQFIMAGFAAFIGVCLLGIFSVISLALFVAASACWLAILNESSDGIDRIEGWPDPVFYEWLLDGFYVLMATAVATVPGWAIAMFLGLDLGMSWFLAVVTFFVVFPFVLLSMLEVSSPWAVFSSRVFGSFFCSPIAWIFFIIESLSFVAMLFFGSIWAITWSLWFALAVAPIVVAGSFVYFRLLGRLGWCISRSANAE